MICFLFGNRNSVLLSLLTFQKSVWNLQLFVTTFGRSVPTWQGPNTPLTKQVTCKPAWTKSWTKYIPFNQLMWWKHCFYFAQVDYNGQMLSITSLKHSSFCSDWLEWPDSVHTLSHLQNWCPISSAKAGLKDKEHMMSQSYSFHHSPLLGSTSAWGTA